MICWLLTSPAYRLRPRGSVSQKLLSAAKWTQLSPIPEREFSTLVFSRGHPQDSRLWMAELTVLAGDIELNPGPNSPQQNNDDPTTCSICNKAITNKQFSITCHDENKHKIHKTCTKITLSKINSTSNWLCQQHYVNSILDDQSSTKLKYTESSNSIYRIPSTLVISVKNKLPKGKLLLNAMLEKNTGSINLALN